MVNTTYIFYMYLTKITAINQACNTMLVQALRCIRHSVALHSDSSVHNICIMSVIGAYELLLFSIIATCIYVYTSMYVLPIRSTVCVTWRVRAVVMKRN